MSAQELNALRVEILRLQGQLRYQKAVAELYDHAEELAAAKAKIQQLKNINKSLRTEIRMQRHEIANLREERNVLLNWDKPSPPPGNDVLPPFEKSPAW